MSTAFGILVGGSPLEPWQLACVRELTAMPQVRAAAVLRTGSRGELPPELVTLPEIDLTARARSGIAEVKQQGLDFVFALGGTPCPAELLDVPRWGVWRIQFGDWIHIRGGPAGYWETYAGQSVSTAQLVRLTSDENAVVVLREGSVRTAMLSASSNCAQLRGIVTRWPAQVCRELQQGLLDRLSSPPLVSPARFGKAPRWTHKLIYRLRISRRMAAEGFRALFRHTQWNVGIAGQPVESFLSGGLRARVSWLESPRRCEFRADPFGIVREGRLTILLEDFSYVSNRGTIRATDPETGHSLPVEIGPQPPVHLSYPYVLESEGKLFCIPEAHEAREVALYEVSRYPDRWRRIAAFPLGTVIVDATVFKYEDRWWIAGSEPGVKGASSELYLWYAPALEGPWMAHPGNPVKTDIRSARPAGTPFEHGGVLYRPAQDCSGSYGGQISLNRVTLLNPVGFREEVVAVVKPETAGPYPEGIHTLSRIGNVTLVDGKRTVFVPQEFRRNALHFLRQAARRLGLAS